MDCFYLFVYCLFGLYVAHFFVNEIFDDDSILNVFIILPCAFMLWPLVVFVSLLAIIFEDL